MTDLTGQRFEPDHFRAVLGHFPTGVTVVTGLTGGRPVGMTIGSFTSVSLDPPLVGFLPMQGSSTWSSIADSDAFCVNVLSRDQADLCWRFAKATDNPSRFEGVSWSPGPTGSPVLDGAAAWIDCRIESVHDMGDHHFVLGRVVALDAASDPDGQHLPPLIFFKGALGEFIRTG